MQPPAVTAASVLGLIRREGILELPEGFGVDGSLFEAGLDSMAVMQLLVALGEQWPVEISAADVTREHFGTAAALAGLINRRGGG